MNQNGVHLCDIIIHLGFWERMAVLLFGKIKAKWSFSSDNSGNVEFEILGYKD